MNMTKIIIKTTDVPANTIHCIDSFNDYNYSYDYSLQQTSSGAGMATGYSSISINVSKQGSGNGDDRHQAKEQLDVIQTKDETDIIDIMKSTRKHFCG